MIKKANLIGILCLMFLLVGCEKVVSTEHENVEVEIQEAYYQASYTSTNSGKGSSMITHPAVYKVTVKYNGDYYTIYDEETYHKYKDKEGQTAIGVFEISTYDDGSVTYEIIGLVEESYPSFVPEETYDYSFTELSGQELYEDCFERVEEEKSYYHYYVKDGVLYLDEYADTGRQDEEGIYIYEWQKGQEIAQDVIFVDYNDYFYGANALYITADQTLHGTGMYEDVYVENVQFARAYADQLLVLTMDGEVWCKGVAHCIGNGNKLEYKNWEMVLQDVAFANVAHYRYMAITDDGSLYMWGDNTYGQFGDGSLLSEDNSFDKDKYFYKEPVKVADNIKMVWECYPGSVDAEEPYGELRTYFLTNDNLLFVCGENVGEEAREYSYFGEMGEVEQPISIICTSELHKVEYK